MPVFSFTFVLTKSIKFFISLKVALFLLTKKFECLSEIAASPKVTFSGTDDLTHYKPLVGGKKYGDEIRGGKKHKKHKGKTQKNKKKLSKKKKNNKKKTNKKKTKSKK